MTSTIDHTAAGTFTGTADTATAAGFSMPAPWLADLLAGAAVAAGKDATLPVLTGVQLAWDHDESRTGGKVTAAATDRYRLIVGTIERRDVQRANGTTAAAGLTVNDAETGAVLVPASDVARIVRALRAVKCPRTVSDPASLPPAWVAITADRLTVTTWDGVTGCNLLDGQFPKWETLIPSDDVLTGEGIGAAGAAYNADYLASFAKIPRERHTPMVLRWSAENRPMLATVSHPVIDWRALLMPVRRTS